MRPWPRAALALALCGAQNAQAQQTGSGLAAALQGKSYIIELSSSQYGSGYGDYLVPPMVKALKRSGLRSQNGPGADLVVNIQTGTDVGQWMGEGEARQWLYTLSVTVGLSPEAYVIPYQGTPAFGVEVRLLTPNSDREDELACLIELATRAAIANYRPTGHLVAEGSACARK